MNLFKKLFGANNAKETTEPEFRPDNSKLLQLIAAYHKDPTPENYSTVIQELYGEHAFLVVPTTGKKTNPQPGWTVLKKGATIQFKSVFNVDGLLIFGVFTSEFTLSKWIEEQTNFISMPAKVVLGIAEEQGFVRIVIDSEQETMFVLERDVTNQKQEVIAEDTEVLIWTPEKPISSDNKKQLQEAFAKVDSVKEVYHLGMTKNNEHILLLAIVLDPKTENAVLASRASVNDGMQGYSLDLPLEIMYLKPGDDRFKEFELFYKR